MTAAAAADIATSAAENNDHFLLLFIFHTTPPIFCSGGPGYASRASAFCAELMAQPDGQLAVRFLFALFFSLVFYAYPAA